MSLKNKRVLITGGAGFIGRHLVEKLVDYGSDVIVVDNLSSGSLDNLSTVLSAQNFEFHKVDIRDLERVKQLIDGVDIIFHQAAELGVTRAAKRPIEVLDVDLVGVSSMLSASVDAGVEKFVYASTSEVYGECEEKVTEEEPVKPKSVYAVAKLAGEKYCESYEQVYGLKTVSLRYFNIYGPYQDKRFVIPRFIDRVLRNEPPLVYGNGSQTRNFCYIDDAINANILVAEKDVTGIFNVAGEKSVSILKLAELIMGFCGKKMNPTKYNPNKSLRPPEYEVQNRDASYEKANKILGYQPNVSLEQGLKTTITWFQEKLNEN